MVENQVFGRAAVGAWIEIDKTSLKNVKGKVAPPVGAWIEIYLQTHKSLDKLSLPPSDCPKTKLGSHPQT